MLHYGKYWPTTIPWNSDRFQPLNTAWKFIGQPIFAKPQARVEQSWAELWMLKQVRQSIQLRQNQVFMYLFFAFSLESFFKNSSNHREAQVEQSWEELGMLNINISLLKKIYFLKHVFLKIWCPWICFSENVFFLDTYQIRKYIWNTDLYPNWYVPHGARILIQCQHDITYLAPSPATLCARVYIMRLNPFWKIHTNIKSSPCIFTRDISSRC